ncbi:hypothetical protein [Arthrobacter sp. NPDC057009]|uniref:hypothetical protein n=1 Tax=Arthrobacter sp. NPDC057009 TaxID=3345996 RepID=UPI003643D674
MASGIYGADIDQLRALSKSIGQSKQRLENVESTVNSLLQSAAWKGADGDKFRNAWTSSLRPMLSKATESLEHQSKSLLTQAAEQEKASSAGGVNTSLTRGISVQASTGKSRNWGGAFTDPNYDHAPSGVEWMVEKFGAEDGNAASDIASAIQFVADKFSWTTDLGQIEKGVSKFFDFMRPVGKVLGVLGAAVGALDIGSGLEGKDPFRMADGFIGAGLSVAAIAATGTILGAPAGIVLGGVALGWGLLGMMSGDVPVTKRIWDFGAGLVGGVRDMLGTAKDAKGRSGGKFEFG